MPSESAQTPIEKKDEPSLVRRYVVPVVLGVLLGLGLLYLLGRLAEPGQPEEQDESTLMELDPRLVITMPELPDDVEGGEEPGARVAAAAAEDVPEPPPCGGGVEDADCLRATVPRAWQLFVGVDPPAGAGPPVVASRVGDKLRWNVLSARAGLVVSFLVEEDGSVLLLYPTPVGDLPVIEAGVPLQIPRAIDRGTLEWGAPGPRRVFALVGATPFFPPAGEDVGGVATYYDRGEASQRFFHGLRRHVHRDLAEDAAAWSLAEVAYRVEPAA